MENFEQSASGNILVVSEEVRSYIYDTTRWTKFLSIIGFIFTALIVVFAFAMGSVMNNIVPRGEGPNPFESYSGTVATIVMILYALVFFYPSLLLYKYSDFARKAVLYGDQGAFNHSAGKLKSYFKFWGVLTIVMILLYILIVVMFVAMNGAGLG